MDEQSFYKISVLTSGGFTIFILILYQIIKDKFPPQYSMLNFLFICLLVHLITSYFYISYVMYNLSPQFGVAIVIYEINISFYTLPNAWTCFIAKFFKYKCLSNDYVFNNKSFGRSVTVFLICSFFVFNIIVTLFYVQFTCVSDSCFYTIKSIKELVIQAIDLVPALINMKYFAFYATTKKQNFDPIILFPFCQVFTTVIRKIFMFTNQSLQMVIYIYSPMLYGILFVGVSLSMIKGCDVQQIQENNNSGLLQ